MIKKKEPTVLLYGQKNDPEVKAAVARLKKQGRKFEVQPRPAFDTGLGACGNHLCHCKDVCQERYAKQAERNQSKNKLEASFDIGNIFGVNRKDFQL